MKEGEGMKKCGRGREAGKGKRGNVGWYGDIREVGKGGSKREREGKQERTIL